MDTYQLIDKAFDVFHLLWVVVSLGSLIVFLIFRRIGWLVLGMAMSLTTVVSQCIWTYCPLLIVQNMVWNRGHPENPRAIRSITCDLVREHLGITISPWVVTASLAALFLVMLWLAFRMFPREDRRKDKP